MFFYHWKATKNNSKLFLDSLSVTEKHKQWNIKKIWIYLMKQAIPSLWKESGTLSMINQMQMMIILWNEIIYNTEVLKSNLSDFNDADILVKGNITIVGCNLVTEVAFKNYLPFIKCITKIDGTTIDDTEDLDLVMPMCNLIEYCSNYSETTANLWFYSRDEVTNFNADIEDTNNFKSFKYNTELIRNTGTDGVNGILRNATNLMPLKYLSNFWRSHKMPLINSKIELKLKWTKYCVLSKNITSPSMEKTFMTKQLILI